jgi:hypothetical protein|tara:strand:+ start:127 stop:720 length:594 start_codon:yes stop_codon:yes gene_type:complete
MKTYKNQKKNNSKTRKVFGGEHYKSGDGMLTSVWGPSLWHFLHTMSFNYPTKPTKMEKLQYIGFVKSLKHILPCKYCRINLKQNFKTMPITMRCLENRDAFSMYIYNLHETVNKMLNKKSGLSYEDVKERYEHFRARCNKKKKTKKKLFKFKKNTKKKHLGCTEPIHKHKSKGVIQIVPVSTKCESLQIDNKCVSMK